MSQTERAVSAAAIPISIEIDATLAAADADMAALAGDLISELSALCDRRDFIEVFTKALAARQALVELGVQL